MRIVLTSIIAAIVMAACNGKASENKLVVKSEAIPVKLLSINQDTTSNVITASGLLST